MSEQTPGDVDQQAQQQTGQRQVKMRIDERNLDTNYANAFRTSTSAEEVIIDFGLNQVRPAQGGSGDAQGTDAEIVFTANDRVVLNYYTAKRLAVTLSQVVRRYEQQFGELKLDVNDRRVELPSSN